MPNSSIVVDVSFGQTRVAIVEDSELVEIYVEDSKHSSMVGNIYKGKVVNVFPGMEAAFIDIGTDRNAFLYVGDAVPKSEYKEDDENEEINSIPISIGDVVKPSQEVLIQVVKEAIGTKGPRVTTNITLPGRYMVLVPNVEYIGISRRIEDETERERLKNEIEKVRPQGYGVIIRTAAEGLTSQDFVEDIDFLVKLWDKIKAKEQMHAPTIIHKDLSLLYRTVRDMFTLSVDKFIINDKEEHTKVLELVDIISPGLKPRVEYYSKNYNIFEFYGINAKIPKALARKVWLKSGGYIIIDQTEALTVIDVNTGKYVGNSSLEETILKINLEAAKEIAKQLRLRDIGGIIIIDFIDMTDIEHQQKVVDELRNYFKKDKTKTHVLGISQLGLVEMTRKKMRQNLSLKLQVECPCCSGTGKIIMPQMIAKEIERQIDRLIKDCMASGIIVEAHALVIKELEGNNSDNIEEMRKKYNRSIILKTKPSQNIEEFEVKDVDNIEYLC